MEIKIPAKVSKFLERQGKHEILKHKKVFTAYDKAATLKIPEKMVGKTLVVKLDRDLALVLVAANKNLNKVKLKILVNETRKKAGGKLVKSIGFATEVLIKKNLKGVKVGAVPPFGALWKLPTFVDGGLMKNPKIIVNSGNHSRSLKINPTIFKKLPSGIIGSFSQPKR